MAVSSAKAGARGRGAAAGGDPSCSSLGAATASVAAVDAQAALKLHFKCERCQDACTVADSHPLNAKKPFEKRKCCACASTDRALQRAQKGDTQFKKEWSSKSLEKRVAFYRMRKLEHQRGTRHNFEHVSLEVGEQIKESGSKKSIDLYVPFEAWRRDKSVEEPEWVLEDFEKEWKRLINETEEPKIFERGQWLIGRFHGVEVKSGESRGLVRNLKRQAEVESADMLAELMDTSKNMASKYIRSQAFDVHCIQPTVPAFHDDVEGERRIEVSESKFGISLQRELAKRAMEDEKQVAMAMSTATATSSKQEKHKRATALARISRIGVSVLGDSCLLQFCILRAQSVRKMRRRPFGRLKHRNTALQSYVL